MTLEQFIATRRRYPINDPLVPNHAQDHVSPQITHVLIYAHESIIYELEDGNYWLVFARDDFTNKDLESLEAILYEWWADQ